MQTKKYFNLISALAVFGLILAGYLFAQYLIKPESTICSINSTINCDAVIKGEVSNTLGIPTSLYGLVGYAIILVGALFKNRKLVIGTALFGTLFCLRITFIEIFQIHVYCPICILCQLNMVALLLISLSKPKVDAELTPFS